MNNFEWSNPTNIIFGKDTEKQVGQAVSGYSKSILIHYGSDRIKKNGLFDKVTASLEAEGIRWMELGGVKPNPRLGLVKEGIEICRKNNLDFILAIGGGSVIDSSKAIGVGVVDDGDIWDFFIGKRIPVKTLPVASILTIPAAGSEASKSCVITKEEGWYKRPINENVIKPVFAIMNPELTYTLPHNQTVNGVADIMAHIIERYFTSVKNVDLTDRMCEGVLKAVIDNAPILVDEPDNYAARAEIMWASTLAHNDLLSTGRIGDWGSHQIEHELSAIYDVAHGAGLAVILPAWMKYAYKHDVKLFVKFAVRVWNVDERFDDPERTALEGIERMKSFFSSIGLPVTLQELGIPTEEAKIDEMVKKAFEERAGGIGNFLSLKEKDVKAILMLAVE